MDCRYIKCFFCVLCFFRSTPEYPQGQLNPEAYFDLALFGGFVMAISIIFSTISTRNEVSNLSSWKGTTQLTQILNEILIALTNKSFLIFFFGNLSLSICWGLLNNLTLFINTDFWGLKGSRSLFFIYLFFSAFLAFALTLNL